MKTLVGNVRYTFGCLFALTTACLCGCSIVGGPRAGEIDAIQQNHQTVVLARVVCMDDVQRQKRPTSDFILDSWRLDKPDGKMDPSPGVERVSQRTLSKSLRDQGWFYFVIDPGNYCLKMTPTTDNPSVLEGDNHLRPFFYLSVPADKQLVYAGTIAFDRGIEKQGKHNLTTLTTDRLSDESQLANTVIGNEFAAFGEMTPHLLVSYDSPAINSNQVLNAQTNPANSARPTPRLKGDNWHPAELAALPLVYSGVFLLQASGNGNGDGAAYVAAAGGALLLLAAPIALTTEAITAEIHHKRCAPYEAAFQKEVAAFQFDEKLQQSLTKRLSITGANSVAMPALSLDVQSYRIILRGDIHQRFNLEVAARVRLSNWTDHRAIWEHDYLYTCLDPNQIAKSVEDGYQTIIPSWYGQHRLEEYRGDAGSLLFQRELESAVGAITDEVIGNLYAAKDASSTAPAGKNVAPTTAGTPPQSLH